MLLCAGLVGLKSESVKISLALVRPWWVYKQQTHSFATIFACPKKAPVRREREPKDKGTIGTKKNLQRRLYPTLFDIEKVGLLVQNALSRFLELCFLPLRGAHFCKHGEKIWAESEKCTLKTLDGELDASMCGLGGAKK